MDEIRTANDFRRCIVEHGDAIEELIHFVPCAHSHRRRRARHTHNVRVVSVRRGAAQMHCTYGLPPVPSMRKIRSIIGTTMASIAAVT